MKKNIIFIPARVGSTRVRNKNIQKIGNETLLSRKIKICLKAKIGDVIVSTNSPKIKKYADYKIFGNVIILGQGADLEESHKNINLIVDGLKGVITE